jgi:hypothetical protein
VVADIITIMGITMIITQSYIFRGVRMSITNKHLKKLINCCMCVGFWIGIVLGLIECKTILEVLKMALIGSIASYTWFLMMKGRINKYD